ncbi:hypothetical protein PWT90_05088 [Aphanocladium album]|nr:hypothetical protein PWT90_05088 [Aphanocladium album]
MAKVLDPRSPAFIPSPPKKFAPWVSWSSETREIFKHNSTEQVYDAIICTTAAKRRLAFRGTPETWFASNRFHILPQLMNVFDVNIGTGALQCERCGRMYDHKLQPVVAPRHESSVGEPVYQMSFVYCSANIGNRCMTQSSKSWNKRLLYIDSVEHITSHHVMEILSHMDPKYLISSVFGDAGKDAVGTREIMMAYRALRVIWIRSFASHQPKSLMQTASIPNASDLGDSKATSPASPTLSHPSDSGVGWLSDEEKAEKDKTPNNNAPVDLGEYIPSGKRTDGPALWIQTHFKKLALWGDIQQDVFLFLGKHIQLQELEYLYGLSKDALITLNLNDNWASEREWLQAYAGMRRSVSAERYQMMRTASQRINTSMGRFLAARYDARFTISSADIKLYAMNGVCFRELQSALCAPTPTLLNGLRAIGRPDPTWWKESTRETKDGKRIHLAHATPKNFHDSVDIWKLPSQRRGQQLNRTRQ